MPQQIINKMFDKIISFQCVFFFSSDILNRLKRCHDRVKFILVTFFLYWCFQPETWPPKKETTRNNILFLIQSSYCARLAGVCLW